MVQIAGKYELVKNENLIPHLLAWGVPEDKAKAGDSLKPKLEITVDGKKITFKTDSGAATSTTTTTTFVLDQEVDEATPSGNSIKSTAKLNGDTLTISSKAETQGKSGDRTYKFSENEVVLTLTSSDSNLAPAKRFYKRI